MTVHEWVVSRTTQAPPALVAHMLAALGSDAEASAQRTADVCLAAASRSLDALLVEHRFGRGDAIDLLAIDALTTLAFEYVSESGDSVARIVALATESARTLGQLVAQRV